MLYLAEVKKQTKLFMGGTRTTLNLLACQQNENRWSAIPGEETISSDDITEQYAAGALVTVNLGSNRQIQGRLEPAGKKIANLLQSFSRQVEKIKTQQEEIEQWKQSLTIQADEINRREEELQDLEEHLADQEEEFQELEQERAKIQELQEQLTRERSELERAWEHLRGEQQRLEQLQQELESQQGLTPSQLESVGRLVAQVESAIAAAHGMFSPLQTAQEALKKESSTLQNQWQSIAQKRQQAEAKKREAQKLQEQLNQTRRQVREKQKDLMKAQQSFLSTRNELALKQKMSSYLGTQLHKQSETRNTLSRLVIDSPLLRFKQELDTKSLEAMSIEQLEEELKLREKSWQEAVSFVKEQEEELDEQLQTVQELEDQLKQVKESELQSLKNELAEEQERYRFLERTLVGQRHNLMAREDLLQQHQKILRFRRGESNTEEETPQVDLSPIFKKIDGQRYHSEDELYQLTDEIETLKSQMQALESKFKEEKQQSENLEKQLERLEQSWQAIQQEANQLIARVEAEEEILSQREQDLPSLRQPLEEVTKQAQKINSQEQQNELSQIRKMLDQLS